VLQALVAPGIEALDERSSPAPATQAPRPASGAQSLPQAAWSGLPTALDPAILNDDILWWEETCHDPSAPVSLVWVGRARAVTSPIRLELVQCGSRRLSARWLDGGGQGARWIGSTTASADA